MPHTLTTAWSCPELCPSFIECKTIIGQFVTVANLCIPVLCHIRKEVSNATVIALMYSVSQLMLCSLQRELFAISNANSVSSSVTVFAQLAIRELVNTSRQVQGSDIWARRRKSDQSLSQLWIRLRFLSTKYFINNVWAIFYRTVQLSFKQGACAFAWTILKLVQRTFIIHVYLDHAWGFLYIYCIHSAPIHNTHITLGTVQVKLTLRLKYHAVNN